MFKMQNRFGPNVTGSILFAVLKLGILVPLFLSCQPMTTPLQLDSLNLQKGTRLLICEAQTDFPGYEARPFRKDLEIPGINIVGISDKAFKGWTLDSLAKKILKEESVQMALIIVPSNRVEKRYEPYIAFKGWRTKTYREEREDGRYTYWTTDEPVYEYEYRYKCTRIVFKVFQYSGDGNHLGSTIINGPSDYQCPDAASEDIEHDEIDGLMAWLESSITMK